MANCMVCASSATVYCEADNAFLCADCDVKVHSANVLSQRHSRVPTCQLCCNAGSTVYCTNDKAYLCNGCDKQMHTANALSARHVLVPAMEAYKEQVR